MKKLQLEILEKLEIQSIRNGSQTFLILNEVLGRVSIQPQESDGRGGRESRFALTRRLRRMEPEG